MQQRRRRSLTVMVDAANPAEKMSLLSTDCGRGIRIPFGRLCRVRHVKTVLFEEENATVNVSPHLCTG